MIERKVPTADPQSFDEQSQPEQMADTFADRLMNELFDGVERALEGDVDALDAPPPADIAETSNVSELTLSFTEGGLPAVLLDSGSQDLDLAPESELAAIASESSPSSSTPASQPKRWQHFWTLNRALLGAAGLTLLATLGLWFHQRQPVPVAATNPTPTPTDAPVANPDAEFLEYLRRSLDVIAQNAPNTTPETAATGVSDVAIAFNNGGVNLPSGGNNILPPPPGNISSAPGSINVIERVYVPYPSTQAAAGHSPSPSTTASGTVDSSSSTTAAAPAVMHTLVGVLELGERSAALFEIDGTPQRVYIGERIGDSGWSLVSVANEEAVVRRNGEVRTLYIGQRF